MVVAHSSDSALTWMLPAAQIMQDIKSRWEPYDTFLEYLLDPSGERSRLEPSNTDSSEAQTRNSYTSGFGPQRGTSSVSSFARTNIFSTNSSEVLSETTRGSIAPSRLDETLARVTMPTRKPVVARPIADKHPDRGYKHKMPTAGGLHRVHVQGDKQLKDSTNLDSRYTLQRDGPKFFIQGRVFSMMFHEGAGYKHGRLPDEHPDDDDYDNPKLTTRSDGVRLYSHIRRMAVIRAREGYCVCVPISSYGRQGIQKKRLKDSEVQAHAIVYSSELQAPTPLRGEPNFVKRPIAIDLCNGQELISTSRIHFGKFYTVEWNIKVMNVGFVAQESMADFEVYWTRELRR